MAKVVLVPQTEPEEKYVSLKTLKPGEGFRRMEESLDEAMHTDETTPNIWIKLPAQKDGSKRIRVVSADFKEEREFDDDRAVIKHAVVISIIENASN